MPFTIVYGLNVDLFQSARSCAASVHGLFGCGGGVYRYAHHRWPQDSPMEDVSRLERVYDGPILLIRRLEPIHRLMLMRIELLPDGIDSLRSKLRHIFNQLLVNQLEALAVILVFLLLPMRCQRVLESVNHWDQTFNHPRRRALRVISPLFLDPLPVIVKIRLSPQKRLSQIVQFAD